MKDIKYIIIFLLVLNFSQAEPITPIPLHVIDVDIKKVKLGKELFFDPILSINNTIACINCHILNEGGDDNSKVSLGIYGKKGTLNTPTVFNARYNFVQFWDGRAKNLQDQVKEPIKNPNKMGNNFPNLIKTLKSSSYMKKFKTIYKDGVTEENIANAIAEYEKTLITPNAPFDRYLRGDKNAITSVQKRGYELFTSKGCVVCHNGINIGGNLYAKSGNMQDIKSNYLGRYNITKDPFDKYFLKVPTLRNIARTAPYLHDGRFNKLENVVKFLLHNQLRKTASESEVKSIVEFLKTLNGEIPKNAE